MIKFSVDAFPKFTRNRILTVILLIGISLTAAGIAFAVQANPGHGINTLGGVVQGDVLYGSGTDAVSALAKNASATRYISNTGATNNPAWAQVDLSNGVTGTIGTANLGSGTANSTTYLRGDQTWATPSASAAWGGITGTLSSQTDLNTALGLKEVAANKNASGGYAGLSGVNLQIYNTGGTVLSNLITVATTPQTYTFPDVSGNVLTSGAIVTVPQGGNGAAPGAADQILVSDSTSAATWRTIGDCTGSGKALQFNVATNAWGCNTLQFYAQSVTTPAAGFAADTYLVGSSIPIPTVGLQAGSRYHLIFQVSKTAGGTVAPTINIRYRTAGVVADTSRCLMTFAAQTAAVDTGTFDVWATFRTVGTGTTAIIQCVGQLRHNGTAASAAAVGLGGMFVQTVATTGGGFDSTVASSKIGVSINGGTSAAWTITLVQAELTNLN